MKKVNLKCIEKFMSNVYIIYTDFANDIGCDNIGVVENQLL